MTPWLARLFRLGVQRTFAIDWPRASRGAAIVVDVCVRRETHDFQVLSTLLYDGLPLYVTSHGWEVQRAGLRNKGSHQAVLQTPATAWLRHHVLGESLDWQRLVDVRDSWVRPCLERSAFAVYGLADDVVVKLKKGHDRTGRVNILGRQGFTFNLDLHGKSRALIWADREMPSLMFGLVRPTLIDFLNLNMHRLKASTLIHFSEEEVFARVARNLDSRQEMPRA